MTRRGRALAVAGALAAAAGCGGPETTCGPGSGVVARVIDGDTIELATGEKIRYLLIDTPESTNGATDCYGQNAKQLNSDLVLGKTVDLTYDDAACTDRFGRLLAYVAVDGVEINRVLVERGYACYLFIPPAGTDRALEFENLELGARTAGRGMWSACPVVTCD